MLEPSLSPSQARHGAHARSTPRRGGAAAAAADAAVAQRPPALRRFPYPYRSMVAIASDLDETPDGEAYHAIARFLNTTDETAMGRGLGLEVGNTIYFAMPPGQFAYWSADAREQAMVRALIRSGHIDSLHSFGDLARTRADCGRALAELLRHGLELKVWIDHARAPSNLGEDIMGGSGDVPGAPVYHSDLTTAFGVEYVWRGRITSVIGQGTRRSLGGLFRLGQPLRSSRTLAKELAKGLLARTGNRKYAMHGPNALMRPARLRDGRPVFEFLRSNPCPDGVEQADTAAGLAATLRGDALDRLVAREAAAILYTHLGKGLRRSSAAPFDPPTRTALRGLAEAQGRGRILVTTTRRLLDYHRVAGEVRLALDGLPEANAWDSARLRPIAASGARHASHTNGASRGARWTLRVDLPKGLARPGRAGHPAACSGLTVYLDEPARTAVLLNGEPVEDVRINPPDDTGRASVSLPWPRLVFPSLDGWPAGAGRGSS